MVAIVEHHLEQPTVAVRLAPTAIDPDPEATKTYTDVYERYLAAFDAVESALAR